MREPLLSGCQKTRKGDLHDGAHSLVAQPPLLRGFEDQVRNLDRRAIEELRPDRIQQDLSSQTAQVACLGPGRSQVLCCGFQRGGSKSLRIPFSDMLGDLGGIHRFTVRGLENEWGGFSQQGISGAGREKRKSCLPRLLMQPEEPKEAEDARLRVEGEELNQVLCCLQTGRASRLAEDVLLYDRRSVRTRRRVRWEFFQEQAQFFEHHGPACVDGAQTRAETEIVRGFLNSWQL